MGSVVDNSAMSSTSSRWAVRCLTTTGPGLAFFQARFPRTGFFYLFIYLRVTFNNSSLTPWPTVRCSHNYPACNNRIPPVLPQGNGNLPAWQMVVAASALFNTVQNFVTLSLTKRLYNNVPAAQPGLSSIGFMTAEFVLTSTPQ